MLNQRQFGTLLLALAAGALALSACTRSASTPPAGTSGGQTPEAFTGSQATIAAVQSALLTQTAQAAAHAGPPTATSAATHAAATATPGINLTPVASATPTGAGCPTKYIVQPGDRLFRISINLGYDPDFWMKIAEANHIPSPWIIYPGQELTIPCP